jgi:hypothetical protein
VGQQQYQVGDLVRFSDTQTCETDGCETQTRDRIWMGERWRLTCEEHQWAVQDEIRPERVPGGSQGSGFTLTCGREDCDAPWFGTVGLTGTSPQEGEKPHVVICANRHKFAVLEMRAAPGGPTAYRLGTEIGGS